MPPPASAIPISTNPFSVVVSAADFNAGTFSDGVANEAWLKLTNAARLAFGIYTNNDNVFFPTMVVFKSDGTTIVKSQGLGASAKKGALWADVALADAPHYVRIRKNPVGASAFDFTFQSKTVPIDGFTVDTDDLIINDDTSPFPAAVISRTGTHKGFLTVYPAGEIAASLPGGASLVHDRFNKYGGGNGAVVLISGKPNPAFVMNVTGFLFGNTFPSNFPSITANDTDFYLLDRQRDFGTGYHVYKVTSAGVVTHLGAIVSPFGEAANHIALGVNMAGTVLYFATAASGDNHLHKWNLSPFAYGGTLYDAPALNGGAMCQTLNFHPGDILSLPDDSVVFWHQDGTFPNQDTTFVHVSAAGVTLHTKVIAGNLGGINNGGRWPDHLTRLGTDSAAVKIWLQDADVFFAAGEWFTWTLATGAEGEHFRYDLFNSANGLRTGANGTSNQPGTLLGLPAETTVLVPGPSESCFMIALRDVGGGPGPGPGSCVATQTMQCIGSAMPSTQCNTNSPRSTQSIQQTPAMNRLSVSEAGV